MFVNVYLLKKNCPEEIKKDMAEIVVLSKKLVDNLDIEANQYLEQVKVDIQESKDLLFQIISRFVTIISNNLEPSDSKLELGYRLRFSEDIGNVLFGLRERSSGKIDKLLGITKLLSYAGELKIVYDFIIYHPIVIANKSKHQDLKEYIKRIFKAVRVNASILSSSEKQISSVRSSQMLIPKPASLFIEGDKKKVKTESVEKSVDYPGVDLADNFNFEELDEIGEEDD